jgi:hypothetical protein
MNILIEGCIIGVGIARYNILVQKITGIYLIILSVLILGFRLHELINSFNRLPVPQIWFWMVCIYCQVCKFMYISDLEFSDSNQKSEIRNYQPKTMHIRVNQSYFWHRVGKSPNSTLKFFCSSSYQSRFQWFQWPSNKTLGYPIYVAILWVSPWGLIDSNVLPLGKNLPTRRTLELTKMWKFWKNDPS